METERRVQDVDFMGGHPALDLVDTVGGMLDTPPAPEDEFLRSYDDLVALGLKTDTLSEPAARRLRRAASQRPEDAQAALRAALEARALLDSVFRPVADGEHVEWCWEDAPGHEGPLWPLVDSAVGLVTDCPLDRLSCGGRLS